jgi:hypothetical protein
VRYDTKELFGKVEASRTFTIKAREEAKEKEKNEENKDASQP